MRVDLNGKTAVVTGSSKGIGFAIAEALAAAGANVTVSARNREEVERAAASLNEAGGGRVVGIPCDVRSHEEVKRLIQGAVDEFGAIDILINNAGVGAFAPMGELTPEHWTRVIETNLNGVYFACHEALPHMKGRDGAWIINIASLAGKNPFAGGAAYNASKFGLVGFSEALMLDVRHEGIRVNYIMPGSVATYFNEHTPGDADAWKIQPEDIADLVIDLLAMHSRTLPSRIEVRPSQPPKK
ncbi:SDR family oxidoreductase [soil metagenome]